MVIELPYACNLMLCLDWTFPAPLAALPETSFRVHHVGLARENRLPFRVDASGQPRSGRKGGLVPAQR